jgi:hypothetical protein
VPYTVDKEYILAPETNSEATKFTPDQWQTLFTGYATHDSEGKPKEAGLS